MRESSGATEGMMQERCFHPSFFSARVLLERPKVFFVLFERLITSHCPVPCTLTDGTHTTDTQKASDPPADTQAVQQGREPLLGPPHPRL